MSDGDVNKLFDKIDRLIERVACVETNLIERVSCVETNVGRLDERVAGIQRDIARQESATQLNASRIFDLAVKLAGVLSTLALLTKIAGAW